MEAAGAIGTFRIISEGSIAAGVRRIEALTGESADEYDRQIREQLQNAADVFRVKPTEVVSRIESLLQQNRELERKLAQFQQEKALSQVDKLLDQVETVDGVKVLVPPDSIVMLSERPSSGSETVQTKSSAPTAVLLLRTIV